MLSRRQLHACGLDDDAIAVRVGRRTLFRRHRGVYAVGRRELTRRGELRAALLRCGRAAAISHRTAGWCLDVLNAPGGRVHVTTTAKLRRPGRADGIALHTTTRWGPDEVVWVDGLPCTSVERTLADLAADSSGREFVRAWNAADQQRRLDSARLAAQAARQREGASVLRARLDHREALPPDASDLELRFLALLREHGIREPKREWRLVVGDREGRLDFVFEPEGLAIELDSRRWHEVQDAHDRDRAKDLAARELGLDLHRYTYDQIRDEGPRVAAIIARTLSAARRRLALEAAEAARRAA